MHDHERQEEAYLVWEGTLTLIVEGEPHDLGARRDRPRRPWRAPADRQPRARALRIVALGATPGAHTGRDGLAWASWEDTDPPRSPQDVPLPDDLPEAERRR